MTEMTGGELLLKCLKEEGISVLFGVLTALLAAVKKRTEPKAAHGGFEKYRALTQEWQDQMEVTLNAPEGQINPGRMVQVVRDFFPREAITCMDGGNITVVVSCDQGWGMERSSQLFAQIGDMVECDLYPETRYDRVAQQPYEEVVAAAVAKVPLGRFATPEDVANLVAFLASSEASFITGQAYNLTGGRELTQ